MPTLFDPLQLGNISCKNRIFMAPLTRLRNTAEGVPTPIMAEYYGQRADAGLIVAESAAVSRQGFGFLDAPGIWNGEQIEGWKRVTGAVHDKGGKIVCQLWHGGRVVFSGTSGEQPVAPSVSRAPGLGHTWNGKMPFPEARALRLDEIPHLIDTYAYAARNALAAGFDGVQVHSANGYLLDEFLRDSTNHRTDQYGGSPENRMRLLREVCEAVMSEVGANRVGVRLSPNGEILGCIDSDPAAIFIPTAAMLQEIGVAWLGLREADPDLNDGKFTGSGQPKLSPEIRKAFTNPLVLNGDYTFETAEKAVQTGAANAISFGRAFISNPDLVKRFREHLPLQPDDKKTWYGEFLTDKAKGYTDYPFAS